MVPADAQSDKSRSGRRSTHRAISSECALLALADAFSARRSARLRREAARSSALTSPSSFATCSGHTAEQVFMTPFSVARLRHSSARAPRRAALRGGAVAGAQSVRDSIEQDFPRPVPPPRTKWTRLVPHPVLIGHAASQPVHGQRPRAARAGARPRAASRDASRRAERGCARGRSSLRRSRTRTRTGRSWCLTGKAARGRGCGCSGSAREPIHAPGRGHPFSAVGWVWARAVSVASAPPRVILLGRALGRKPQWILQAEATLRQERSAPPDVPLSPAARTRAPRHAGLRG